MWAAIGTVACGGALGAVSRFGSVALMAKLFGSHYPVGTWFVNWLGSFLAGLIMILLLERFAVTDYWRLFLVVGFLGGFTTFSSYSWETWVLFEGGEHVAALLNMALNNVCALGMAFVGIIVGRWIGGMV
ncbi:fluoride efflux transporter CrcB [Legionella taurinensis]|uniref:fluoride efflux transporter CrcB n=1 Tax=Legionella taurinensis TaxID=70611 RepID=UPI000E02DDA1|nr:fluoride efflux transporter CrcB [Legionella taurinensis]MDX1837724.1 fluoride efflux transporter CrcB [Legionella taurinensis]STY26967.1 camphor resistance [Legionella taurinensis]